MPTFSYSEFWIISLNPYLPNTSSECGEELVLGKDSLLGKRVKKRRLPSVGISDDSDRLEVSPLSIISVELSRTFIGLEFFEEGAFLFLQVTLHDLSIGLSLSLGIFATTLAGELHTHTIDTRSHMLDCGELDLEFGLW